MHLSLFRTSLIAAIFITSTLNGPKATAQQPCTLEPRFYYLREITEDIKNLQAALDYTQSTQADPNMAQYYIDRAELLVALDGDFDTHAIADYNTALGLDPQNPDIYLGKANTFFFLKRYQEAIRTYRTAIELYASNGNPDAAFATILLAQTYIADERYEDANAVLMQLTNSGEQPALTNAFLGALQSKLGYPEIAEAYWSLVEDLDPDIASFFIEQAFKFYKRDDMDTTIANAALAIRFSRHNPNRQLLGYFLRASATMKSHSTNFLLNEPVDNLQPEQTIADLTQAIQIDPNCAPIYGLRGFAYSSLGKSDLALADLDNAIRLDPSYYNPYQFRGQIYQDQGLEGLADADMDYWTNHYFEELTLKGTLLGDLAFALEDYREAESNYYIVLIFNGEALNAYLGLGAVYKLQGRMVEEYLLYTRYIEAYNPGPDSPVHQRLQELEQFRN